jgi:hypothetical protein
VTALVPAPATGRLLLDGIGAEVVDRAAWGAEPAIEWPPERSPVRAVVVHHTSTIDDAPDPLAMVRRVQRFHAHHRGWGDIGYSFVVLRDGRIVEGREGTLASPAPLVVQGGHALGHNPGTVGVAIAGRFHDHLPTEAAWAAAVELIATVVRTCDLDPVGGPVVLDNGRQLPAVISAHRHACETTCPGDALVSALPALRYAVVDRCRGTASGASPSPAGSPPGSAAGDVPRRHRRSSSPSGPDADQNAG